MLTGQYPSRHRVNQSFSRFAAIDAGPYRGLRRDAPTLGRLLGERGWRTVGIATGGTVAGALGFYHGFDIYQEVLPPQSPDGLRFLSDLLDELAGVPFFLFVHTFAPHAPYLYTTYAGRVLDDEDVAALQSHLRQSHVDPIEAQRRYLKDAGLLRADVTSSLYEGGVLAADTLVGSILEMLDALDLAASTLVVVTSDHGEEFGEHDPDRILDAHCATMFDELLHVPLLFRLPGVVHAGQTIERQVRLIDLAPTVLDLLGVPIPDEVQGSSLVPLLEDESFSWTKWSLSEATCAGPEQKALRTERFKYVAAYAATDDRTGVPGEFSWERFYRLDRDPGELESVHQSDLGRMIQLRSALETSLAQISGASEESGGEVAFDEELREQLRTLGYIQ